MQNSKKEFTCNFCGNTFSKQDKFCPVCLKDDEIELFGYCPTCEKITSHEDGFSFETMKISYFCMECNLKT